MAASMYLVAKGLPGNLWIMPCPDATVLAQEVADYRAAGVNRVVSMLAQDEAEALGLSQEGTFCMTAGMAFRAHPIVDFGLPEPGEFAALVQQIVKWLKAGQNVAVHCRAGIGRSGMITAGVLIAMGKSADEAVQDVTQARGVSIPDTVEQGKFLAEFAMRVTDGF